MGEPTVDMGQVIRAGASCPLAYPFYLDRREHALEHGSHELELRFRWLAWLLLKVIEDELGRTSVSVMASLPRRHTKGGVLYSPPGALPRLRMDELIKSL